MAFDPKDKSWYFACVSYPDSMPDDYAAIVRKSHCEAVCSPLHEPDEDIMKPHLHWIFKWSNSVSFERFMKFCKSCGLDKIAANGYFEPVSHPQGAMRYLLHLDDGDKQQFEGNPFTLCSVYNAFPLDFTRDYTKGEVLQQRNKVFNLMRDLAMTEYKELLDYLMDNGFIGEFDYACKHTILLNSYLASFRHGCYSNDSTSDNSDN